MSFTEKVSRLKPKGKKLLTETLALSASGNSDWIESVSPYGASFSVAYTGSGNFDFRIEGSDDAGDTGPAAGTIFTIDPPAATAATNTATGTTPIALWPERIPCHKSRVAWTRNSGSVDVVLHITVWEGEGA